MDYRQHDRLHNSSEPDLNPKMQSMIQISATEAEQVINPDVAAVYGAASDRQRDILGCNVHGMVTECNH